MVSRRSYNIWSPNSTTLIRNQQRPTYPTRPTMMPPPKTTAPSSNPTTTPRSSRRNSPPMFVTTCTVPWDVGRYHWRKNSCWASPSLLCSLCASFWGWLFWLYIIWFVEFVRCSRPRTRRRRSKRILHTWAGGGEPWLSGRAGFSLGHCFFWWGFIGLKKLIRIQQMLRRSRKLRFANFFFFLLNFYFNFAKYPTLVKWTLIKCNYLINIFLKFLLLDVWFLYRVRINQKSKKDQGQ